MISFTNNHFLENGIEQCAMPAPLEKKSEILDSTTSWKLLLTGPCNTAIAFSHKAVAVYGFTTT